LLSFAGIDLTSSRRKPSAYALLKEDLSVSYLRYLHTDAEIISEIERDKPTLVAIDAPLRLPQGLCCLNRDCTCQPASKKAGRLCERELAKSGIPCYFTTKRSIIKEMVYRAIALKEELLACGFEVIEVYPYATKVRLWGKPIPRKTTPNGLRFLAGHLAVVIPDIVRYQARLDHDLCDALLAAYTAYLHYQGKTEAIGDSKDGWIYIPFSK
jgi:predicted nuclease with RNAse H fold